MPVKFSYLQTRVVTVRMCDNTGYTGMTMVGGLFEFSLFSSLSFRFKYPVSAVCFYFDFHISSNSESSSCLFLVVFSFPSFPNFHLLK